MKLYKRGGLKNILIEKTIAITVIVDLDDSPSIVIENKNETSPGMLQKIYYDKGIYILKTETQL